MSRYRLLPAPAQEAVLRAHCAHARYVWNLAVEQHAHWHPGRKGAPGCLEQCRQLTAARKDHPWLAAGSQTVQQQALRDFARARTASFDPGNPARRPGWRKAGRDEGFRITGHRVTLDRAGRWHVAFTAVPEPVPAPGNGQVVGIDRGVTVAAALSTGELLRAQRGSNRRTRVKHAIARLRARETDRRKDWAEKTSTDILRSGWGLLVRRLEDKAPGRMEKVSPAFTSQRCSACGRADGKSREGQAVFPCTACGYACHADVNAARNIAAGHAVTARGGHREAGLVNREPQLLASFRT